MSILDTIIKERLQVDERKLRSISKKLLVDPSLDTHALQLDLKQYEFAINKQLAMLRLHAREAEEHRSTADAVSTQTRCFVAEAESEEEIKLIQRLKQQLVVEKDNVSRRQAYDTIAEQILQLPSIPESEAAMQATNEEIASIIQMQKDLDALIEARKNDTRSYLDDGQALVAAIDADIDAING